MKAFSYKIKDEVGIHARPAGMLAKEARKYKSTVLLKAGEKTAEATKLMAVMGMGVNAGRLWRWKFQEKMKSLHLMA